MGKKNKIQAYASTRNSDPDIQMVVQQLSSAAANTNTASLTVDAAYDYSSDLTDLHSGYSSTVKDTAYPANGYISNLGNYSYTTAYHARVDANNVYIDFNGTEYRLSDFLYRIGLLEDLVKKVPDLLDKVANLSVVVEKLEREDALKKLEQVINN